ALCKFFFIVVTVCRHSTPLHYGAWLGRRGVAWPAGRGCVNLTLVSVLPDYGRSLLHQDLYKEFNALKERLEELTTMFEGVETSVDDMRAGRSPSPPRWVPVQNSDLSQI
uniref:Uncharacterized protein n=1 Tax=Oncorhynchus kisutch TaxID=8019 RepID=A0A8C7DLI2_ONCKI